MGASDITGPLARIKNRIESVTNIGLVHDKDIFDHDDLLDLIVSPIGGTPTLRAWMILGPTLAEATRMTQTTSGIIEREWQYTIIGIEGLKEDGSSLVTLRNNLVAVIDAIDADWSLNGTCHRTRPCRIVDGPENRALQIGEDAVGVSYVEIIKPVITLSTP